MAALNPSPISAEILPSPSSRFARLRSLRFRKKNQTPSSSKSKLPQEDQDPEGEVKEVEAEGVKKALTWYELAVILRPFFWPAEGTDGALINRIRSISTWLLVGASKATSVISPLYLLQAVNDLVAQKKAAAFEAIIAYLLLRLASSVFKELQAIVYIKVKQQASIELQELIFSHVHSLSLNWHVKKKIGLIIRVMDRGTEAASTLVTSLFLFLVPALAECLAIVILFFAAYNQFTIGAIIIAGVALYCITTIQLTLWRAKFRLKSNKEDNDYHFKATDSIINYETVKYFTNEDYEIKTYKAVVVKFQQYNALTQVSLSLLNISQQAILIGVLLGVALISGISVVNGSLTIGAW